MRKFLLLSGLSFLFFACNDAAKKEKKVEKTTDTTTAQQTSPAPPGPGPVAVVEKILGSFVGAFGDNKITLLITRAEGDSVAGRSIVGGNDRPFAGTMTLQNGVYTIFAKEPGDHKDDGAFNFTIEETNPDEVKGSWTPNDKKRPTKDYSLTRREFKYNAEVGSYPEASKRLLKAEDVENLMKEDLEFMRNEIFARHGFCFKKKHLRQQFENEDWYVPDTVDIKGRLTEIEKKNIALIKRYEKYAEEYGDEYGR